jgi:hypothetical protein
MKILYYYGILRGEKMAGWIPSQSEGTASRMHTHTLMDNRKEEDQKTYRR